MLLLEVLLKYGLWENKDRHDGYCMISCCRERDIKFSLVPQYWGPEGQKECHSCQHYISEWALSEDHAQLITQ